MSTISTVVLNTNKVFVISRSTGIKFRKEATRLRDRMFFNIVQSFSESVDSQLDSCQLDVPDEFVVELFTRHRVPFTKVVFT